MSELVSQWTAASAKRYPSAGHVFPSSPAVAVLPHPQTVYKPHLSRTCLVSGMQTHSDSTHGKHT